MSEDKLDDECNIVPLIHIDGIKLSLRSFEINITVKQIMILSEKLNMSNTCLIKSRDGNQLSNLLTHKQEMLDDSKEKYKT